MTFDQIVVFGDSYSDVGNISLATGGAYPPAPYFQGRYSNGPLWIDDLAAGLGLTIAPSLAPDGTGTDYAYGGAAVIVDQPGIPSMLTQTKTYLAAVSGHADPAALYVIWGGVNDLLLDWDNNPSALPALPNNYAQAVLSIVTQLKNAGALRFLIAQVQDAGTTPAWNWGVTEALQSSADAKAMNTKLVAVLNAAKAAGSLGGISIYTLPSFQMMDDMIGPNIASESTNGLPLFGLTNVVSPCVDGETTCAEPNAYFFWDGIHPTATGHAAFAQRALAALGH